MYRNKCLYWEHGTLLSPQHFQLLDQKSSNFATLFTQTALPYAWGFKELRMQHTALATNMITIDELNFIGPNGEHAVLGDNAKFTPRSLPQDCFDKKDSIIVYMGIASWNNQAGNVTEYEGGSSVPLNIKTRYIAPYNPARVHDLHGNGPLSDIRFLYYNLQCILETETELLESMHVVPIARIIKEGDSLYYDSEFIPPCVNVFTFPKLMEWLSSISNMLRAREKHLNDYKLLPFSPSDTGATMGINTQNLALYLMFAAISRALPMLDHLLQTPAIHPWTVFGTLRQIIGELSVFSAELNCMAESLTGEQILPAYNHENCGQCFKSAHDIFLKLTSTLITGPAHTLVFNNKDDRYLTTIHPHILSFPYHYWLQIRTTTDISYVRKTVQEKAKFAPPGVLPMLIAKSLSGIQLTYSEKAPTGLPNREDTLFFAIDEQSSLWRQILNEGDAALFLPQLPKGTTIHLVVINN